MKALGVSMALLVLLPSCLLAQQWSEKDLQGLEVYQVDPLQAQIKAVKKDLGDVYVAYSYSGKTVRTGSGQYVNVLEYAFIFAVSGPKVSVLGRFEKYKVIDAYGKTLYDVSKDDPPLLPYVIGLSSTTVTTPMDPALMCSYKDPDGRATYGETNPIVLLNIDASNATIVRRPSGGD
jgi:hypothetical protein